MRWIAPIVGLVVVVSLVGAKAATDAPPASPAATISFRNDVMPILSKAGCNAGACHGNKSGKAGFKLSLFGQDPDIDFNVLTREFSGRRVNCVEPGQSLILLKATAQIPHEGGLRFKRDSAEYATLRQWIEAGVPSDPAGVPTVTKLEASPSERVLVEPADRVQVRATATFSDGSKRDVSMVAVYEPSSDLVTVTHDGLVQRQRDGEVTVNVRFLDQQEPVRLAFVPARPNFVYKPLAPKNYIDEQVFAKLKLLRMNPSEPCSDGEFLRRAYLDLLGELPTADEAKEFIADPASDKRGKLIDALFDRPEFADFWALKWSDLLRNEERTIDRKGVQAFHHWIRESVAENKPLDAFVRELVSGRGSTYTNPPANYYRANRTPTVRGEATAEVFLGVRLQCAQCHNHPFDRWTQDDYYGWADVFGRVEYKIIENRRTDTNDSHEFVGEQIVYESPSGDIADPRGDRAVKPRLLGEAKALSVKQDRLDALAAWITSPTNPFFAKAQVNRIWYHLMGRGLVDPIDDFRPTNPASHPALLDALAKDFVEHHYDVRYVIKLIMTSQVYALSSDPNETNADDEVNYSHVVPRRLTAEQLLDAEHQVAGVPTEFAGYPKGMRATQIPGVRVPSRRGGPKPTQADGFLVTFGKPARLLVCECERSTDTTLGQTFQLISGPEITKMVSEPENWLGKLIATGKSDEQIVDELYWATLSRGPDYEESKALVEHVKSEKDRRKGLEDVLWALLNAKEFVLRR